MSIVIIIIDRLYSNGPQRCFHLRIGEISGDGQCRNDVVLRGSLSAEVQVKGEGKDPVFFDTKMKGHVSTYLGQLLCFGGEFVLRDLESPPCLDQIAGKLANFSCRVLPDIRELFLSPELLLQVSNVLGLCTAVGTGR